MSEHPKAVFLSYASQDAEAARCIAEALRAAGVEVWFDQSELVGGDAWDAKIRGQIMECALFVPVISAHTQARLEGYFRLEWKLGAQRTLTMADERVFLLPVVIDETRDAEAKVPAEFRAVQWTRLPGGLPPPTFTARVRRLLSTPGLAAGGAEPGRARVTAPPGSSTPATGKRLRWLRPVLAGLGVAAIGAWLAWPPAPGHGGPAAKSDPELDQASALSDYSRVDTTEQSFALAEEILKGVLARRPTDLRAVTLYAWLNNQFLIRGFDRSDERRALAQKYSDRAYELAPDNPDAIAALGFNVYLGHVDEPRAERLLRRAIALRPDEPKYQRLLCWALIWQNKSGEAVAQAAATARRFPRDALARYDYALMLLGQNDYDAADKVLDQTLALASVSTAWMNKNFIALWWRGDVPAARAALGHVDGQYRTADMTLGVQFVTALVSGDTDEALAALSFEPHEWLMSYSEAPKAQFLGELLLRAGKPQLALEQFTAAYAIVKQARQRDPANADYRRFEAWALLRLGRMAEARALLGALKEEVGDDLDDFIFGYLQLSLLTGDKAGAVDYVRKLSGDPVKRRFLTNILKLDPHLAPWRDDAELQAALAAAKVDPKPSPPAPAAAK